MAAAGSTRGAGRRFSTRSSTDSGRPVKLTVILRLTSLYFCLLTVLLVFLIHRRERLADRLLWLSFPGTVGGLVALGLAFIARNFHAADRGFEIMFWPGAVLLALAAPVFVLGHAIVPLYTYMTSPRNPPHSALISRPTGRAVVIGAAVTLAIVDLMGFLGLLAPLAGLLAGGGLIFVKRRR